MSQDCSLDGPAHPAFAHQSNPLTMMPTSLDLSAQTPMSCPVSNHQTIENHGAAESEMMGGSGPVPTQHAQILHLTDYINDLKRMRMELLGR